ncbi:peptidase S8/S53 domain-containing protein [Blastocladiella britannica]|nr:peptidase S8/S53 domain-containing protein [Blastocladiella britannica]
MPAGNPDLKAKLAAIDGVRDVDPTVQYQVLGAEQNPSPGLDRIDGTLDKVFNFPDNAQGQGVDCYIVDSGIDVNHSDFGGRASMQDFTGEGNGDSNGHGSHVSGTVAGSTFGIAKKCTLIGMKVFDRSGRGNNNVILRALQQVSTIAKQRGRPGVVNMSLGGPGRDSATQRAIQQLTAQGIAVVVAAGNESQDACNVSPAFIKEAITVGAADPRNDQFASFSNFGSCVDVIAPGVNIPSVAAGTRSGSKNLSGTSMATPHVAGIMAALMSTGLSNTAATQQLIASAQQNKVRGSLRGTPNKFAILNPRTTGSNAAPVKQTPPPARGQVDTPAPVKPAPSPAKPAPAKPAPAKPAPAKPVAPAKPATGAGADAADTAAELTKVNARIDSLAKTVQSLVDLVAKKQ